MRQLQDSTVQFFHETELFRVQSSTMVPGLLQTEGYAAALLSNIADFRGIPFNDGAVAGPPASNDRASSTSRATDS